MNEMEWVESAEAIEIQERTDDIVAYEASTTVPFLTAAWASVGVAIMASTMVSGSGGMSTFLSENILVAVPFVAGVYLASYTGGRWLAKKGIRENVFASMAASFLVAEGVLFAGSVLGSLGGLIQDLMTKSLSQVNFSEFLAIPLMIAMFGAMFCLPLAVGLGAHIRLWSLWKTQRTHRFTAHSLALREEPAPLPTQAQSHLYR